MKCPKCGRECERDMVDVGVGEMAASPWGCFDCLWVEGDPVTMPDQPTDAGRDRDEATAWAIFHPDRKGPPTITAIAQALAAARKDGYAQGFEASANLIDMDMAQDIRRQALADGRAEGQAQERKEVEHLLMQLSFSLTDEAARTVRVAVKHLKACWEASGEEGTR